MNDPTLNGDDENTIGVSYVGEYDTDDELLELIDLLAARFVGDTIDLETDRNRSLSLTVTERIEEGDGEATPAWTGRNLRGNERGYVLNGDGSEYLLVVDVGVECGKDARKPPLYIKGESPFYDRVDWAQVKVDLDRYDGQ